MLEPPLTPRTWVSLGKPPLDDLHDARDQLHWAVQLIAAAGQAVAEPRDDDCHRGFKWVDGWLVGVPLRGMVQVALKPEELILALQDTREMILDEFPMQGRSMPQCRAWLESAIGEALDGEPPTLTPPDWEIPAHTVGHGADFGPEPGALAELASWYANADLALSNVGFAHPGAGQVRGWPHHFDIALLITLAGGERTVGAGMTPGDAYYPEPYWYVSPWPYPEASALPPLSVGRWHTDKWTGAVLTFEETVGESDLPEAQHELVAGFLEEAVTAAEKVAGKG